MKKVNLMPLILAGSLTAQACLSPIAMATAKTTTVKAKTEHGVQMSTETILAKYETAIAKAKNETELNLAIESVTNELTDVVQPEVLEMQLAANLAAFDPEAFRLGKSSTNFSETAQQVFAQRHSTGLFFKGNCSRDNRRLTALILGIVAVSGGIVALVLSRSDASIKRKYDNLKLNRKKAFDDENYFITNAPELIARENEDLQRQITGKGASIIQQQLVIQNANIEIAKIDEIFLQVALGNLSLTPEQAQNYKNQRDSWVADKNNANANVVELTNQIIQITQKINDNEDRIAYYSVQANINYELDQAEVAYNTDINSLNVQYQNSIATAPGRRKAGKWVAIGSGIALATGVVFLATANGCDE